MNRLEIILNDSGLGSYTYAIVEQVVLINEDFTCVNYFTHVEFEKSQYFEEINEYITKHSVKINNGISMGAKRIIVSIDKLLTIYEKALKDDIWEYGDSKVILDNTFETGQKYIPSKDPTGGKLNFSTPLEWGLYGSNFNGNYYLIELFSNKTIINELLSEQDIAKINNEIKKIGLSYNLSYLKDRIGNVVLKAKPHILKSELVTANSNMGIKILFSNIKEISKLRDYTLQFRQEFDGVIYENRVINQFNESEFSVEANQMLNTITILSNKSNLIVYSEDFDFRQTSNYYSLIMPNNFVFSSPRNRCITIDNVVHQISLSNQEPLGVINSWVEMKFASERKYSNDIDLLIENHYVLSFRNGERNQALEAIRTIVSKNILWDLQEIWIVDPYLMPKDMAETVFHCIKPDIRIKALTSYGTIKDNEEASKEISEFDFEQYKAKMKIEIEEILGDDTDIELEYHSKYKNHGFKFHDRYIMLIYDVNRTRIWSLGASINQLGNTHHTIQIVNNPDIIEETIRELWNETGHDECVIYKSDTRKNL